MANVYRCLLAVLLGCQVTTGLPYQAVEEQQQITLRCLKIKENKVTWSRETDGGKVDILTADGDRDQRHIKDPQKQYGSLVDKSLSITRAEVSDSGTYFCNNTPAVELTVIPPGTTVCNARTGNVCLTCPHRGGGSDISKWSKERAGKHQQIQSKAFTVGQTLKIKNVGRSDSGLYYCDGKPAAYLNVTQDRGNKNSTTKTTATTITTAVTTTTVKATTTATTITTAAATPAAITTKGASVTQDDKTLLGVLIGISAIIFFIAILITAYFTVRFKKRGQNRQDHIYDEISDGTGHPPSNCGPNLHDATYSTISDLPPAGHKTDSLYSLAGETFHAACTNGLPYQAVEEQQQITLRCLKIKKNKVTWSRETDGGKVDILTADGDRDQRHIKDPQKRYSSQADGSLSITRAEVSDSGTYFCNNKPAVELTVIPPGTTVRNARTGNVYLNCPHHGGGSDISKWSKERAGKHQQIQSKAFTVGQTLKIENVGRSDSGLYYCDGKPAAYLNVTQDRGLPYQAVEEQQQIPLRCLKIKKNKVTWSRETDGGKVDILTADGDRDQRHIKDPQKRYGSQADGSLSITRAEVSDSGTYFCNNKPAVELTVIPPGTTVRNARTGNVYLNCPHHGGGSDISKWSKERAGKHQQIQSKAFTVGQTLKIENVGRSDSGLYYCDGKPAAYLNVTQDRGLPYQAVEEQQQITLRCLKIKKNKVTWSRETDGGKVDILTAGDGDQRHIKDPQKRYSSQPDRSLSITRAEVSDSGTYFCNNTPAVELTVIPPGTTVRNARTGNVSLNCPHHGGGSDISKWSKERAGKHQQIQSKAFTVGQTLKIKNVGRSDSGLYYCDGKPAAYLNVTQGRGNKNSTTKTTATTITTAVTAPTITTTTTTAAATTTTAVTTTTITATPAAATPAATTAATTPATTPAATTAITTKGASLTQGASATSTIPKSTSAAATTLTTAAATQGHNADNKTLLGVLIGISVIIFISILITAYFTVRSKKRGQKRQYHVYDEISDGTGRPPSNCGPNLHDAIYSTISELPPAGHKTGNLYSLAGETFHAAYTNGGSNQNDPTYCTIPDLPETGKNNESPYCLIGDPCHGGNVKGSSQLNDKTYVLLENLKAQRDDSDRPKL
ncbi:uncharacterized protein KZ484_007476 [Pholidichthys leucotaenia]